MMLAVLFILHREAPLATGLLICDVEEKNEEVEQASLNSLASNNLTDAGKNVLVKYQTSVKMP